MEKKAKKKAKAKSTVKRKAKPKAKSKPKTKTAKKTNAPKRKWSQKITDTSHAMDLQKGVFTWKDPKRIAKSLLQSASKSHTRKSPPYRSAMSMLNFYVNRAGKDLPASEKQVLKRAKEELRLLKPKES